MGVVWAAGWAGTGLLIGALSNVLPGRVWDYFFDVFDAPLPALAIPGFVGGALFSLVLGIAWRNRPLEALSIRRVAILGAVGGLLLSLVPAAMVLAGLATLSLDGSLWRLTAVIAIPLILLSAASAAATLYLAQRARKNEPNAAAREPL